MSENESDTRQELSDDELNEVSGGLSTFTTRNAVCKGCKTRVKVKPGERFPDQCPQCGSGDFTIV